MKIVNPTDRTCIYCGCTDSHACAGGCSWVITFEYGNAGVCSECVTRHAPVNALRPAIKRKPRRKPPTLTDAEKRTILEGSKSQGRCKGCGCRVSADSDYCGECLCEEDTL